MLRQVLRYMRNAMFIQKHIFLLIISLFSILGFILYQSNNPKCESWPVGMSAKSIEESLSKDKLNELKQQWLNELKTSQILSVPDEPPQTDSQVPVSAIQCLINDEKMVQCLKSSKSEIYMPFDFIQNYFDVYGKMKHYDGYDRFEFQQSNAKDVYNPKTPYTYSGVFMTFETSNVEARDRVKCISGITGVPLSTQWHIEGYYYGIQIAQFGMSHYSKHMTQKPPTKQVYENAEESVQPQWAFSNKNCLVEIKKDFERNSQVIKFTTPDSIPLGSGVSLVLGNTMEFILSFDLKMVANGSLSVVLETNDKMKQYTIHYITNSLVIDYDLKSNIYYGIGPSRTWRHMARDLLTDLKKGIGISTTRHAKKVKVVIQKVSRLIVRGRGYIDNVTLSTSEHLTQFFDASQWMYLNQDKETGGWKNYVERKLEGFETIPSGWISAMGQGQGMSVLSRAYHVFHDPKYIVALSRALQPFTKSSEQGGVRATFLKTYTWYEEYPTKPSSFVLNGFMYSLIGLYDFKSLLEHEFGFGSNGEPPKVSLQIDSVNLPATYKLVNQLYHNGMTSLTAMLPLYDGGSHTFYDLRHFMLHTSPNVARWGYHVTHLSQLVLLYSVSREPVLKKFINNWSGYLKGKVAKHN
ncbi:D-glucuronyl C5-epimerase [Ciona intestinalis]